MQLTHYGHACVLVELSTTRILLDPGTYSEGFEALRDLDLILITHAHPDHVDVDRLRTLISLNPDVTIVHTPGTTDLLAGLTTTTASPGDILTADGVEIGVLGSGTHAPIHPDLPSSDNNGYLIDGRVLHPGDALDPPGIAVDVLLAPAGGPWMKLGEGVDYVRAVAPRVVVPIHQAGLAPAHQQMHHHLLRTLAPSGTELVILEHAVPHAL
ncbi:MBL fold metallo-hydrolase [Amycolatopsis regifaucium]|uniref:MBL fold metallo-hydrolase n=1 Tax=Amycolatopsis regifaucium TaxID=546365 RepID=A0A154MEW9_9PSEU|nr:MBL fold metallo-hydrolase [Amycolatopsis regifaucium]KZB83035.1 MBL fold metallo-hydrolase [Amycolatopsis regifaucium]OKA03433.1 MBL fold metallo-hydrolase [Amycolatopsis regifaucium]SFJ70552.1 L-ascorbate metabolism protein UlaG, beta-lactamase superfamily [Amycolatopsis regifaucium]